jgi:hypothetical protein
MVVVWSMLVTAASLVARIARARGTGRLAPITLWEVGFIWVILPEWLLNGDQIAAQYGQDRLDRVLGLLIVGHCVTVIVAEGVMARKKVLVDRPSSATLPRVPISGLILVLFIGALWIPRAVAIGLAGRTATLDAVGSGALGTITLAAGLLAPSLIAQRVLSSRRPSLVLTFLLSSPFIVAAAFSGTRFYLLFAIAGPLAMYALRERISLKRAAVMGSVVVVMLFATLAMLEFRQAGLESSRGAGSAGAATVSQSTNDSVLIRVLHPEGVIAADVSLTAYFESRPFRAGDSVEAVLLSPIPRILWADKPNLLGYWFPRAVSSDVSVANSLSYAYIGEGYSDAGLPGVLIETAVIGLILGQLQATRLRSSESLVPAMMATLSYPMAFFAIRSPVTTLVIALAMFGLLIAVDTIRRLESRIMLRAAAR